MVEHRDSGHSRRQFVQRAAAVGGALIVVNALDPALPDAFGAAVTSRAGDVVQPAPTPGWMAAPGRAQQRYDGLAKVTGSKIYGRDFRAQDLPGWPKGELRVVLLRTGSCDRIFLGPDVAKLKQQLRATQVMSADDFAKMRLQIPLFFGRTMMARHGVVPDYLGQPGALVFFASTDDYLEALPLLADTAPFLRFGAAAKPAPKDLYGETRLLRYTDDSGKDLYSSVADGHVAPPWEAADKAGSANARCVYYGDLIAQELKDAKAAGWEVLTEDFTTQVTDPMFMEPECGLAWYDRRAKTLQLTLGTQSPHEDGEECAALFAAPDCPVKVSTVVINACYPGGGFGGRDHSDIPLYLALAAVFAEGRPVRLVNSRMDQFQGGIKRHAAKIRETLAVNQDGHFQVLKTAIELNGGGQNNYSFAVQAVAALNASSGYYFPKCDVQSKAVATIAVAAGSMRGFGTYQSIFAMESLIDEAAAKLQVDPIALRLKNLLTKNRATPSGARPTYEINSEKLLRLAAASELWRNREADRARLSTPGADGKLYGVGFALAVKSYGTNLDACLAEITIAADGRIALKTNAIDMGNGTATTLPLSVASVLGHNADVVHMGATHAFDTLMLVSSFDASQDEEQLHARDPRWVPFLSMATSASASAYQMRHAVIQAAQVVRRFGIWPAALALWGAQAKDLPYAEDQLRFQDGSLHYAAQPPLAWSDLVKELHRGRYVHAAMVHTYYRAQWAEATFKVQGTALTLPVDAMAIKQAGARQYTLLDRQAVSFPPYKNNQIGVDLYTPFAALVAVEIDKASGAVKVVKTETFLDCGSITQRDIVEGQAQGGLAMGIGHALLEDVPPESGGAGEGGWNLHRYRVALAGDVALNQQTLTIIEPQASVPAKGMAEVVFCAVPPAVANAVAHATGKRWRSLPITAEQIKGSLT